MNERMNLRYTLLLIIGLVSRTFVSSEDTVSCNICNGDPNAVITIPEGQLSLAFIGLDGQFASCQDIFDSGRDGFLFKDECDILLADPTVAVTCGCTSAAAPIPAVPTITPAPILAPVVTPAPVIVTPAPVIAPVTPAPVIAPVITPAPVVPAPVTPAPLVPTALETPAPIIPTPPTTLSPIAASVRAPTAASQRVPTLPEQPVSMPTTTRNGTRKPPTLKPIRNKPVVQPVVVRKPTRTNPRSRTPNPTKVRPRHNNTPTVVVKDPPRNIAPQKPPTKQKLDDDVSMNSQVQSENLISILTITNSTTVNTNIDNNHINEVADMNVMAETVDTIGDLPSLLVSLDYTNIYKRHELFVKKHDDSKTNSE